MSLSGQGVKITAFWSIFIAYRSTKTDVIRWIIFSVRCLVTSLEFRTVRPNCKAVLWPRLPPPPRLQRVAAVQDYGRLAAGPEQGYFLLRKYAKLFVIGLSSLFPFCTQRDSTSPPLLLLQISLPPSEELTTLLTFPQKKKKGKRK